MDLLVEESNAVADALIPQLMAVPEKDRPAWITGQIAALTAWSMEHDRQIAILQDKIKGLERREKRNDQ